MATTDPMIGQDAIGEAYGRLNSMLGSMDGIDFEAKFRPLIQQAQEQPQTPSPGGFSTFAAAMGNPGQTANFLSQRLAQIARERQERDSAIIELKKQALHGDIAQQMEKGKFRQALAQGETLARLNKLEDENKRKQALDDYKEKTKFLFEKKGQLEGVKASNASDLIQQRAKAYAKTLGLNDRLTLELQRQMGAFARTQLSSLFSRNSFTGELEISPEDMDRATAMMQDHMIQVARQLMEENNPEGDKGKPAAPTTAAKPVDPAGILD